MPPSAKPKGKHKDLLSIPQWRRTELDSLICKGQSSQSLAALIQDSWGLLKKLKTDTLSKKVQRYRKDVVEPHLHVAATKIVNPEGQVESVVYKKPSADVDVNSELSALIKIQINRVQKLYDREIKTPLLMEQMRKEIMSLGTLLSSLSSLQFDMGILHRVPREIKGDLTMAHLESDEEHRFRKALVVNDEVTEAANRVHALLMAVTGGA